MSHRVCLIVVLGEGLGDDSGGTVSGVATSFLRVGECRLHVAIALGRLSSSICQRESIGPLVQRLIRGNFSGNTYQKNSNKNNKRISDQIRENALPVFLLGPVAVAV